MTSGNLVLLSVPETDLITPTLAAAYPVGAEVQVSNGATTTTYVYIYASIALTAYVPYVLDLSIKGPTGTAAVALATPGAAICVPQVAFTQYYYGFVVKKGACSVLHTTETWAAGDMLCITASDTFLSVDGSTGSTIKTVNTLGITVSAGTTAIAGTVILNGEKAVVAA
jgi:hypothetical protein